MRIHRNSNHENSGAKETHQLNHNRPNLRQPGKGVSHQPPVLLLSKVYDGTVIESGPTYRRAIKEVSKAVNLDWINNQACRLAHEMPISGHLGVNKT